MKFFKRTFRKHRNNLDRALKRTAQRFTPQGYDERRVLFALGQAARNATDINGLYELIVKEVAGALGAMNVSLFVRDDATGGYVCRVPAREPSNPNSDETGDGATALSPISSYVLAADALSVKRLSGLGAPLGLTPEDLETWLRAAASFSPARRAARERECATLRALDARLLLGITMQERLVGILSLGPRQSSRSYTAEDKRMLMSVASQLAFIIENAKLAERMVAAEGLRRELALAREVQQRLLPAHPPATPSLDLAAFCRPARAVSGDYYDFLTRDDGQLAVAVADVAGKGISAALLMSSVQASLRSQSMAQCAGGVDASPATLVRTMNRLLYAATGAANYVTFFYAQFDEEAQAFTYVNAGHNPPLLLRAGNAVGQARAEVCQSPQKTVMRGGRRRWLGRPPSCRHPCAAQV